MKCGTLAHPPCKKPESCEKQPRLFLFWRAFCVKNSVYSSVKRRVLGAKRAGFGMVLG